MNSSFKTKIFACWLGKSIGGTLGLPAEGKMERQHLTFYDPVPTVAPPNDDLELQLVWLHLVENAGTTLTQADFSQAWLDHIHYMWDEYGRTRWNLRRGVPVEAVGSFENPFHAGMGSPGSLGIFGGEKGAENGRMEGWKNTIKPFARTTERCWDWKKAGRLRAWI